MYVDQLPAHQREIASYCHSCGELRSEDELGTCFHCGYQICGMDGCTSRCACDDASASLMAEIDGALETIGARIQRGECVAPAAHDPTALAAIIAAIDTALASRGYVPA